MELEEDCADDADWEFLIACEVPYDPEFDEEPLEVAAVEPECVVTDAESPLDVDAYWDATCARELLLAADEE